MSDWNPAQYERFKSERAQPFRDLVQMIRPSGIRRAVDLGCGTGELTAELQDALPGATVLGIDSSAAMLAKAAAHARAGLEFRQENIVEFRPQHPFDLVFSNAALQWLPDHERLLPRILHWIAPHGQVAVQMPYNFDHPSHRIAAEVAAGFASESSEPSRTLLPLERYAVILHEQGFKNVQCRTQVYLHPMASGMDVVEWTRGTLLTGYEKRLSAADFAEFLTEYRQRISQTLGTGPYIYAFKRLLFSGTRAAR